ncbi:ATP-dependent DNA helicase UvrD2 [Corynebacterium ciconiae]|uniref:ATP-dependent DNA helicase UvrD2 n=1 Tax=Corynebacterium ciconiae TaxID=227319 RepID=UPI00047592B7|nr:ATP-dependent DNA helicase UvrD2 [Corynebacterium ciconiae]
MFSLDDLDEDQRRAAAAPRGPVCILAGAGTGKTRTITYRIANLVNEGMVSPNRVLAVTFTTRAAGELRQRLRSMGVQAVQARTFHSAARRQLAYFWPSIAGDLPWRMLDNQFGAVARAVRAVGLDTSTESIRDVLGEISWAKASLLTPEAYPQEVEKTLRTAPANPAKIAQAYERYEQLKNTKEGVLLDFDDLLIHVAGALENAPAVAEEFRDQYRTFVVDEYQDVTPLQQRVLDAWLGDRSDLTVVGDANQTIYSFTGATPRYLLDFQRRYPHATTVRLQRDYRSTPQITTVANMVIGEASGRIAGTRLQLEGLRPPGPAPSFESFADEHAEARGVVQRIHELMNNGVPTSEIAVLFRIRAQSPAYEQALADAGIPYQVQQGEGFYDRAEVRQAMALLVRAAQKLNRQIQVERTAGVAEEELKRIGPSGVELNGFVRDLLADVGLSEKEPEGAKQRERWQSLKALADVIEDLTTSHPTWGLQEVMDQVHQRAAAKQDPTVEGVTLATLHAAKGLEWDAVFVVGLVEKTLPISHAIKSGNEAIEEERRLFYVGITRAREHLFCSWALARKEGGRASRKRSRFLDVVVPEVDISSVPPRSRRSKRCRVCGKSLMTPQDKVAGRHEDCPSGADAAIFERLKQWRRAEAEDLNAPAYIVFTDATLTAIAEEMPATKAELLDISGIGPMKVEQFGESLLQLLDELR